MVESDGDGSLGGDCGYTDLVVSLANVVFPSSLVFTRKSLKVDAPHSMRNSRLREDPWGI